MVWVDPGRWFERASIADSEWGLDGPCFIRPCVHFVRPFMPRADRVRNRPGRRIDISHCDIFWTFELLGAPAWRTYGDMRTAEFVLGLTRDFVYANQSTSSGQVPMKSRKIM